MASVESANAQAGCRAQGCFASAGRTSLATSGSSRERVLIDSDRHSGRAQGDPESVPHSTSDGGIAFRVGAMAAPMALRNQREQAAQDHEQWPPGAPVELEQ